MYIKNILDEDFVNYKKASMYIAFPYCSFKCEKECGVQCCQNSTLAKAENIDINIDALLIRYIANKITNAIVCCGLEPLDSFDDVLLVLRRLREDYNCTDDFVIYTGYNKSEILDKIEKLKAYKNVIIKYGRFIPDQKSHVDPILQVKLASSNQYAEIIS